jgi:hypothetical protein
MFGTQRQHRDSFAARPVQQRELWVAEAGSAPARSDQMGGERKGCDLPQYSVRVHTARRFLRQVLRELYDWSAAALSAAQTLATAVMNIFLLSIVAIFGMLAVVVLFVRDQMMDQQPAVREKTIGITRIVKADEQGEY